MDIFNHILRWKEYSHEIKELFTPDGDIISYLKANTNILESYLDISQNI